MVKFVFVVFGQKLDLLTPVKCVSGSLNDTSAEFEFHSPEWEDAEKTVYFKNYDTDEDSSFVLTDDEISAGSGLEFSPGIWSAYLIGEVKENEEVLKRFVTESTTFKVEKPEHDSSVE